VRGPKLNTIFEVSGNNNRLQDIELTALTVCLGPQFLDCNILVQYCLSSVSDNNLISNHRRWSLAACKESELRIKVNEEKRWWRGSWQVGS